MAEIAVIGASGVYGRNLVPRLLGRGHLVRAVLRRVDAPAAVALGRIGADLRRADILDADSLAPAITGCDMAVHIATAVPRPGAAADWARNDRIRREGTENLIAACKAHGVGRYIQQSIAHLMADGAALVDEEVALRPGPSTGSAVAMEELVRGSGLEWCILRGGAFYGPGTGRDDGWRAQAAQGRLQMPGDGGGYISPIHVADMAAATVAAIETWHAGRVFAVVDDRPASHAEILGFVAALAGAPPPAAGGPAGLPSFRVSNARIRAALGWAPFYASYREGLVA
jgi:nucleoside-diphosphate-sugar epimerase